MSSDLFQNVINKMCKEIMYLIYMYKRIWHKKKKNS